VWCVIVHYPLISISDCTPTPLSSYRKKGKKGEKRKGREGGDQNADRTYVHSGMQISQPMNIPMKTELS